MTTNNPDPPPPAAFLIGVVGVSAAGKSTLIRGLEGRGYRARHIAQEHSYVGDMWQRLTHPDVLIFLDAAYATTLRRRQQAWTESDYAAEQDRLRHAREHADLVIATDDLSRAQVLAAVIDLVERRLRGDG